MEMLATDSLDYRVQTAVDKNKVQCVVTTKRRVRQTKTTDWSTNAGGLWNVAAAAVERHGDGVEGLHAVADLSRDSLSDGEFGIDSAPAPGPAPESCALLLVSVPVAVSISSVSVSDHASPIDLTDFIFLPRGRPRENALLSELLSCQTFSHSRGHSLGHSRSFKVIHRTTTDNETFTECKQNTNALHYKSHIITCLGVALTCYIRRWYVKNT